MTDLSVLIVEDEAFVASAHADFVERVPGLAVVGVVGTVRDASRFLSRAAVDLLLLDLNLPDGSGLEVVRGVRAAGLPVDILTITAAREDGRSQPTSNTSCSSGSRGTDAVSGAVRKW